MRLARDPKRALIRQVPLFADCSNSEIAEIASIADQIDLPAGTALTRQGTRGQEFVVIINGTAEVRRDDEIVATLGKDDFVGEVALVTGQPRNATVVALTPVESLVVTGAQFRSLIDRLPELRTKVETAVELRSA